MTLNLCRKVDLFEWNFTKKYITNKGINYK